MGIRKDSHGFTFPSLLLSLGIFFISAPLIIYIIQTFHYKDNYDLLSVSQFFHYIREDIKFASAININNNTLELTLHNGDLATIEQYNQLIRRRVNGLGHEVYLRDIQEVLFTSLQNSFKITIDTIDGGHYEKIFIFDE